MRLPRRYAPRNDTGMKWFTFNRINERNQMNQMNQMNETLSEEYSPEATLIIYLYEIFAVRNKEKFCLRL